MIFFRSHLPPLIKAAELEQLSAKHTAAVAKEAEKRRTVERREKLRTHSHEQVCPCPCLCVC